MTRIVRALVWKEWREQRSLLAAGVLLSATLPLLVIWGGAAMRRGVDPRTLADALPAILLLFVCPLFAAAAGGATIAGEVGEGTLGFLLSRPAARSLIWDVKAAVAWGACLLMGVASLGLAWLHGRLFGAAPLLPRLGRVAPAEAMLAAAVVLLPFACAVLSSTLLARPMTAAAAGLVASLALLSSLAVVWSRLDLVPRFEPEWCALEVGLAALVLLVTSLHVFSRGEMLRGRAVRRHAAVGAAAALLVTGGAAVPWAHARARLTPATAVLAYAAPSPPGDAVIATATAPDGGSPQVWAARTDGSGVERLTGRLSFAPAVSPDGAWIAYLSLRGWFGLTASDPVLMIARADGSHARRAAALQGEAWHPASHGGGVFSPDSRRVAVLTGGVLSVAPVGEGAPGRAASIPLAPGRWRLVGWTRTGSEVLLLDGRHGPEASWRLEAVDPDSGRTRIVHAAAGAAWFSTERGPARGWRRLPLWRVRDTGPRPGLELAIVDVDAGSIASIAASTCSPPPALSEEQELLVYATCAGDGGGAARSSIHRRRLPDGPDVLLGTVEGRIVTLLLSPARDRVLAARAGDSAEPLPAILIEPDGRVRVVEPGWTPLGWLGPGRAVMVEAAHPVRRLALLDPDAGRVRPFYP